VNNNPEVSVIVTTYNRKELLYETIQSIIKQTYNNFELIIVDNYSNYDYENLMETIDDNRIKYFQNNNDGIIAINRNYGINKAKGKFIAFCDDDDLWFPNKLQIQVDTLKKTESDMVFAMFEQFGAIDIFTRNHGIGPLPFRAKLTKNNLLNFNFIPCSSVLVKKTLIDRLGGFDERKTFVSIEDHDLWLKVIQNGKIHFIPKILIQYRVHKSNVSMSLKEMHNGLDELFEKHDSNFKKREPIEKTRFYYYLRNIFYYIIYPYYS